MNRNCVWIFVCFLFSCNSNESSKLTSDKVTESFHHDSVKSVEKVFTEEAAAFHYDTTILLEKWNSLEAVNKNWIKVERDEKGYLIYDPCDGSTPGIKIDSGKVKIFWQLEEPTILSFEKFTRAYKNKGLYIWARNENLTADFDVKIVDAKRKLVLWKFYVDEKQRSPIDYDYQWLMTPKEFSSEFRNVSNPCPDQKIEEKEFLPIEFN